MKLRHLALEVSDDHIATVTLDKPPVNALGPSIREEIVRVFDALDERDDVRAVVLTAAGKVFCAGADIKEKRAIGSEAGAYAAVNRLISAAYTCILDCGKPVIAAVNGPAIGAGFVMATCCDLIVASENAVFAMPEIDVGLAGGAALLQRVVPLPTLRRMLLTGDRVGAEEMRRLGVVEICTTPEALMPGALALARRIAAKSPTAVEAIKRCFRVVESLPMREGLRFEQAMTVSLSRTDDAKEAQAAFLDKRTPIFRSR